jgi:hypothetical protein
VRIDGSAIALAEIIPIVGQSGQPVTGLPNIEGHEEPYDFSGQARLSYNPSGLDVEGLVRTSSGDFWAVEEYGPSLVHIDGGGKVLRRFVPQGLQLDGADYSVVATLPAIFSTRMPNRGLEGLTLTHDGRTLYLAIQSPLANPDAGTGNRSRTVRILAFDTASGQVTAEYTYRLGSTDDPDAVVPRTSEPKPERATKPERVAKPERAAKPIAEPKPTRAPRPTSEQTRLSALAAVGPSTLLVLERTSSAAWVYVADLSNATNILGSQWDAATTTPSLEAIADPGEAGVTSTAKTLLVDLSAIPDMPDKIEGIAILDGSTIAVANDNDFDIGSFDQSGNNLGQGLKSQILLVRLPHPMP